ncbi:MAG: E3 binding domain-containing protein, partial [Planctomycetaceae bacterium]|nr:E3 binding domain-containing protein [Planctomycetaceae bacterium]
MALEFKLPELGEGVTSADVASLLVAEGETVSAGQNVVELETDKAVVELPIPHAGIVTKILAKLGMTIKPGDPIMLIDTADSSTPSAPATPASPAPASKPASPPAAPPDAATPAAPAAATSSGPVDILLPELGEGVNFADIAGILVNEGDTIAVGQNLMELETDKAVVELPSTHAGTIQKIHIKSGQTVKVGEKLLTIAATSAATTPAARSTPSAAPASSPAPAPAKTAPAPVAPAAPASRATAPTAASSSSKGPAPAGPATRRLARELGVDLHLVSGSGPGGRITIEDLQEF